MALLGTGTYRQCEGGAPQPRGCAKLGALLLLVLVVGGGWPASKPAAIAAEPPLSALENDLKAALLAAFPRYVDWPSGGPAADAAPIVLAVFGETNLDNEIRAAIAGKTVNGRPLVFKRALTEAECATGCHIVYISPEERRRLPSLLNRLKDSSVLTIGESDDFLERGGIIKLVRRERKFKFEVNLTAARRARLEISSKLLKLADAVHGKTK